MLRINFHHLYYFYVIAVEGQVARAAKRLRIGQPTLSTQLKQFEDYLGYRLFDRRRGQTLSLTSHGEILYRYAREIFRLSDEMLAAGKGLLKEERLRLRLGALDWLPKREVCELVSAVLRRFDCFVSVYEDTASQLLEGLTAHRFDLIVTNAPAPHSETRPILAHRIALLPVKIYGIPKFRKLVDGFPGSLEAQPLILPTPHGSSRHAIDDYFQERGVRPRVLGEAQDGELLRRAALTTEALVPLSPSTIERELERGEIVLVGELENVFEEIWLVSMPRLVEHPVVAFLMRRPLGSLAA